MDFQIKKYDFSKGSLITLDPYTDKAKNWVYANLKNATPWGEGFVIDKKDLGKLTSSLKREGFTVSDDRKRS